MKVIVKDGCTAFYGLKLRKAGEVVDFQGNNCPAWAIQAEEQVLIEQTQKQNIVEEPQEQKIAESNASNIEKKNEDTFELIQKIDELLDEAVANNIDYIPDENATLQEQINELTELLKDKK